MIGVKFCCKKSAGTKIRFWFDGKPVKTDNDECFKRKIKPNTPYRIGYRFSGSAGLKFSLSAKYGDGITKKIVEETIGNDGKDIDDSIGFRIVTYVRTGA